MESYKVSSQHYDARTPATHKPIKAGDIRSGPDKRISVTSYGRGDEYSYGIRNGNLVFNTANRSESFPISQERIANGFFEHGLPTSWEDSGPRFRDWLSNARDNSPSRPSNSEISSVPVPTIADIEGIKQERMEFPNVYDTPTRSFKTPEIYIGPINDRGRSTSGVQDKVSNVLRFLYDDRGIRQDTSDWLPYLESVGIRIKKQDPVSAIGVEHDIGGLGHRAAYYSDKGFLVFEKGFNDDAVSIASKVGIPVQDVKHDTISHEALRHGMADIPGTYPAERLQGLVGEGYNTMKAGEKKGTDEERRHKIRAQMENLYAQEYSFWESLKDAITQGTSSAHGPKWHIANMAWQHGKKLGKKGEELKEYVKERVEELYGPLEGEASYSAGNGGLESKLQNASFTMRNGKLVPTIDGMVAGEDGANMPTHFIGRYTEDNKDTYESKGHRSMDDVKANLKKGENVKNPEKPNAEAHEAEAVAEAA